MRFGGGGRDGKVTGGRCSFLSLRGEMYTSLPSKTRFSEEVSKRVNIPRDDLSNGHSCLERIDEEMKVRFVR